MRIVLFDLPNMPPSVLHPTLSSLISAESPTGSPFVDRKLDSGEAKKKIAFLCFSSGTTGKPKVSAILVSFKQKYQAIAVLSRPWLFLIMLL